MIEYKIGNIFDGNENIICHQVNTFGVMGAGIAAQIKKLFPEVFKAYEAQCMEFNNYNMDPIGQTMFCNHYAPPIIANMFSQRGMETDYLAIINCFKTIKNVAEKNNWSVAIPYKIGCGIAKGDWNKVEKIIKYFFEDSNVKCAIYKLEDNI